MTCPFATRCWCLKKPKCDSWVSKKKNEINFNKNFNIKKIPKTGSCWKYRNLWHLSEKLDSTVVCEPCVLLSRWCWMWAVAQGSSPSLLPKLEPGRFTLWRPAPWRSMLRCREISSSISGPAQHLLYMDCRRVSSESWSSDGCVLFLRRCWWTAIVLGSVWWSSRGKWRRWRCRSTWTSSSQSPWATCCSTSACWRATCMPRSSSSPTVRSCECLENTAEPLEFINMMLIGVRPRPDVLMFSPKGAAGSVLTRFHCL